VRKPPRSRVFFSPVDLIPRKRFYLSFFKTVRFIQQGVNRAFQPASAVHCQMTTDEVAELPPCTNNLKTIDSYEHLQRFID
jgi:hypothetical protein